MPQQLVRRDLEEIDVRLKEVSSLKVEWRATKGHPKRMGFRCEWLDKITWQLPSLP
jgi:hypothetical protein